MVSVRDAVNAELKGHVRVCDTDAFLKTVLPLPNDTTPKSILDRLQKEASQPYTLSNRWNSFPEREKNGSEPLESSFYAPFIQAADAILGAIPDKKRNRLEGQWLDLHDKAPQSNEDSPKARPDCLFVARPPYVVKLEKEARQLEMKLHNSTLRQWKEQKAQLV